MLSEYEATQIMFFISCHDQDNPVVKHLYDLHKLRDERIDLMVKIKLYPY